MRRREFVRLAALGSVSALGVMAVPVPSGGAPAASKHRVRPGRLDEMPLTELKAGLASGRFTTTSLVRDYLERIDLLDREGPRLNSIIEVNPDALALARTSDRERKAGRWRGALHGIPLVLKDNIETGDRMRTTGGSLALEKWTAPQDAFLVKRLRDEGAIILGKANLSEWANFRSTRSTSGWSGRGGLTLNPYALDRNPSGSSSGSAVAVSANLCAAAIGTETDGSILSPASYNGIVGLKPTLGLVSRTGVIPLAHSQDTAGPMTRTVADAALLLGCLAGPDAADPATQPQREVVPDYTRFLDPDGLRGARIGVARSLFGNQPGVEGLMLQALETMKGLGAVLIDPAGLPAPKDLFQHELEVLLYEFKSDLNGYLARLGPSISVRSLEDLIRFNEEHRDLEMPWFGQERLLQALQKGPLTDPRYREALEACRRLSRTEGIDAALERDRLDALVAPTTGPAHATDLVHGDRGTGGTTTYAAVAGYPSLTVPAGFVAGLPVGLSFFGRAWSEPVLIRLAFAFEQATRHRRRPEFRASAKPGV